MFSQSRAQKKHDSKSSEIRNPFFEQGLQCALAYVRALRSMPHRRNASTQPGKNPYTQTLQNIAKPQALCTQTGLPPKEPRPSTAASAAVPPEIRFGSPVVLYRTITDFGRWNYIKYDRDMTWSCKDIRMTYFISATRQAGTLRQQCQERF